MCKALPGNRCSPCATKALSSAKRRVRDARAAYAAADKAGVFEQAPAKQNRAARRVTAAETHLLRTTMNHDATRQGQEALRATIADESSSKKVRAHAQSRLDAAVNLRAIRSDFVQRMPSAPPVSTQARKERVRLAKAYDELAFQESRPDSDDQAQAKARRDVFQADARTRFTQAGGRPDPDHCLPDEAAAFRDSEPGTKQRIAALTHMRAAAQQHGDAYAAEVDRAASKTRAAAGISGVESPALPHRDPAGHGHGDAAGAPAATGPHPDKAGKSWLKAGGRGSRRREPLSEKLGDALNEQLDVQAGRQQNSQPLFQP